MEAFGVPDAPPGSVVTLLAAALVAIVLLPAGATLEAPSLPGSPLGSSPGAAPLAPSPTAGAADDCEDHPPIRILDDAMFRLGPAVGVVNPDAAGTAEDPYRVEGWCVDPVSADAEEGTFGTVQSAAIHIANTSAHVLVRDNLVEGQAGQGSVAAQGSQQVGIQVEDAENVAVADNRVTDHLRAGLLVFRTPQPEIHGNTITNASGAGIEVRDARGAAVTGNRIDSATEGLRVDDSREPTLTENRVEDTSGPGIAVDGAPEATITHNRVEDSDDEGLRLVRIQAGTVADNEVQGAGDEGIAVTTADGASVVRNVVNASGDDGLQVRDAPDAVVEENTATNGTWDLRAGAKVAGSDRVSFRNNTIADNAGAGIIVKGSRDATVTANTIRNHGGWGTWFGGSPGVEIRNNTIAGNDNTDVVLREFDDATVVGNDITNDDPITGYGIDVDESDDTRVENNTIEGTPLHGVSVDDSDRVTVANNTIRDNGYKGVNLPVANDPVVRDNEITGNRRGLYFGTGPRGAEVVGNNIHDNRKNGLQALGGDNPLDVRNNWWGASNGPSGGVEDACNGTVADGDGDSISTHSKWITDGEVCFDPWLEAPNPEAGPG